MPREKLTFNQERALRNLAEGRESSYGCRGQSEFGGHERVMWSLRRRGLVEDGEITDSGRAALRATKQGIGPG